MQATTRRLVVWFPDWPVTAWLRAEPDADLTAPVVVFAAGKVVACSAAAHDEGVTPGMRRREAQARCPDLRAVLADPERDERAFGAVLDRLEQVAPGFQSVRAGLCALPARGIARYYDGEPRAARVLLAALAEVGIRDARIGVADGLFTAQQAAQQGSYADVRTPIPTSQTQPRPPSHSQGSQAHAAQQADPAALCVRQRIRVVPPGRSAEFLAPLPVSVLGDESLDVLFRRLGVRTLGAFAALDLPPVRQRLGAHGVRLHALASGCDARPHTPRTPTPDLVRHQDFEPPLELIDQVAFSVRTQADEFVAALAASRLVCTELRVSCTDEFGHFSERVWLHPAAFDAAAVVDRVRWQLAGATSLTGGIAAVRFEPVAVEDAANHEPGLFNGGVDERLHHTLSRLQAALGHEGVVTSEITGGRWLAERQTLIPWGERAPKDDTRNQPWTGAMPSPAPATVFTQRRGVGVLDRSGEPVRVGERGEMSAPPAMLAEGGRRRPIEAWAGPWPVTERGWDAARSRSAHRFQVVDADQTAWLLVLEQGSWWAEGRYD